MSQKQHEAHIAVLDVVEALACSQIEQGVRIERVNMRGVLCKAFGERGDQALCLAR